MDGVSRNRASFRGQYRVERAYEERETHPDAPLTCVAYFSMEYRLSEALPIYVGGLGNVAGDQLKSASDLGVPVVALRPNSTAVGRRCVCIVPSYEGIAVPLEDNRIRWQH